MWFTEDPWPPVLILALAALVFGLAWKFNRRHLYLLSALGCMGLGLAVLIVEEMIVTPTEEVEARVNELVDAVTKGENAKVLDFLAGDTNGLREAIRSQLENIQVQDMRITGLQVTLEPAGDKAESNFRAERNGDLEEVGHSVRADSLEPDLAKSRQNLEDYSSRTA